MKDLKILFPELNDNQIKMLKRLISPLPQQDAEELLATEDHQENAKEPQERQEDK